MIKLIIQIIFYLNLIFQKKNKKRIKSIDNFYKEKINSKTFTEHHMNKVFYYHGKEATLDILNFKMIKSNKLDNYLLDLIKHYENITVPIMPISADFLMKKYKIPEGRQLGEKLKMIEDEWVKNNFKITDQQVTNIVNN